MSILLCDDVFALEMIDDIDVMFSGTVNVDLDALNTCVIVYTRCLKNCPLVIRFDTRQLMLTFLLG